MSMIRTLTNQCIGCHPPMVELHSAPRWKKESPPASGEARERQNLSRSKLAPLLGITEAVYARYEASVSRLTVGRLIHLCEVLGASPEELLAPAALHLWAKTESKSICLLACIDKLRAFDEETLRDVFSLLDRLGKTGTSGHGGNGAATAAPFLSGPLNL
ncbi:helix-turn-helix domain-containing protein [Sinorhizobium meliloti]|uniref:helix-turn-helix domain-containing protein n=1 Tax=Rhizobium meliloti TaxID=382 RepID=UPI001F1E39A0|nr:helix-turn-helix transcriptional regulator [Sinorhizobium meliloti]